MLETIELLSRDPGRLQKMIADISAGGDPQTRLGKIEASGLLDRYAADEKSRARARLLGSWGDEGTLLHISDSLGAALQKVTGKKPLRAWWIAGATETSIRCAVTDDAEAVYFLLLTPRMDDGTVASKAAFDDPFLQALKAQAADFKAFTDPF
jgi:hypothetical protein